MPTQAHTAAPARRPSQSITSPNRAPAEEAMVATVMQPAIGNREWADLVAPAPVEPAGVDVGHAGAPWLADPMFCADTFLSGLS